VTAESLLASLRGRGLRVQRVGPALHVSPRAALTDADRAALREHLVDLRALLGAAVVRPPHAPRESLHPNLSPVTPRRHPPGGAATPSPHPTLSSPPSP
jgi:hypothetical protein